MAEIKVIQKDAWENIVEAVNETVNFIKPTFGPASNKVIISKQMYGNSKPVLDDGVQIARDLEFTDPIKNAVLNVIRETAIKTNDRVGDGTTGALIMLQAIINEVAKRTHKDGQKIEKELKAAFEQAKTQLRKMSKSIKTKEELLKVARISFNNPEVADIIADTWYKIGKEGMLTVANSQTMETFAEMAEGLKLDRGYISPYMVNNNRMECVFENPKILLTDFRLTEVNDILPIMNVLVSNTNSRGQQSPITKLVVICENMEQNALGTAIINKMQGKFELLAISQPAGENLVNDLEDMAIMLGAKVFSMKKGNKLDEATIDDLGSCERIISRRNETVLVGPKGDKKAVESAIKTLRTAILTAADERERKSYEQRLAKFSSKIAVLKIGAPTENELNTLRYKVDDAIHATHEAFKNGVVCGGGLALSRIKTSSELLNNALQVPFRQLKDNVGLEDHRDLKDEEAINVVTGKIGNYLEVGVMDPVEVLIAQVESAISIACQLITTSGMIVEIPPKPKTE